jgi:DNA-directed RNA polymerase subunit M/transcription elongation factor TFIIS
MSSFVDRIPRNVIRVSPQLRASCIKELASTRKHLAAAGKTELLAWEMEIFNTYEQQPSLYVLAMSRCEKWRDAEQLSIVVDPDFNRKFVDAEQQLAGKKYTPKITAKTITFRCKACGEYKSMITSEQRRSADEGMTAKYMCIACEEKKKIKLS